MYYFHQVPVTLINVFQRKRNLAFRFSCHMIIEATDTLITRRPVLNSLPYKFRKIPRDIRLPSRSRREMRTFEVSQKSAPIF